MNGSSCLAFDGWIAGASFASGDTFVAGMWVTSPFGSFADLMWAAPDGTTTLLATREEVATFVGSLYSFDRVLVTGMSVVRHDREISIAAGDATIDLRLAAAGVASMALALRPRRLRTARRWIAVEDRLLRPLASALVGDVTDLRTSGVTASGAREWYAIHDVRALSGARATARAEDLGPWVTRRRRTGFGFSEFPAEGGLVRVTSLIEDLAHPGGVAA